MTVARNPLRPLVDCAGAGLLSSADGGGDAGGAVQPVPGRHTGALAFAHIATRRGPQGAGPRAPGHVQRIACGPPSHSRVGACPRCTYIAQRRFTAVAVDGRLLRACT